MKKLIYISGITSVNLMLFGALFKVLHLKGAAILLAFSILLFCFGFLPSALISSYKSQKERMYKWLYVVTYIVFCFDLVGALFKILHWPYAGLFLSIGLPLPFVLFLPVYLYQTRKDKNKSLLNNLGIMFGLTFLAVFSVLLTLNVSLAILDNIALNGFNNEISSKYYLPINKNAIDKDIVKQKSDELCAFINELKCEVLEATGNNQCDGNKLADNLNPVNTINKNSTNLPIFNDFKQNGTSKVDILKNMINDYRVMISASDKINKDIKDLSYSLFDTSVKEIKYNNDILEIGWQEREFPSTHLAIVLDALSRIQSNVRFVESEYLSSL